MTPGVAGDYFVVLLCCDGYTEMSARIPIAVRVGLGRIVALYHRSSTSHQIH